MPLTTMVFTEATPTSATTIISSQPVANVSYGMPGGVAGLFDDYESVRIILDCPANTTGGALSVVVQISTDGGSNWFDKVAFASIANSAAAASYVATMSLATGTSATVQVGKNAAPALTAGTTIGGAFGDRLRLAITGGAGTSSSINITVVVTAQRSRLREAGGN